MTQAEPVESYAGSVPVGLGAVTCLPEGTVFAVRVRLWWFSRCWLRSRTEPIGRLGHDKTH